MFKPAILITGAAGLLGSRFAEWIIQEQPNYMVIGVDDLSGGYKENFPISDRAIFVTANAMRAEPIEYLFKQYNIQYVVHFAAYAAECVSPFMRKFNYENNVVVTANIVNLCIKYGIRRLLFTSSMAVYGDRTAPFNENLFPYPIDPYGVAKFACEMDINIAGAQHGLDWCVIRPHNMYGRNQNLWDSYRNFIGIAMYKALVGDPITVYGDGLQTRAFSEMTDSLVPFWNALTDSKASKQIINLGGIVESSILEVANIVKDLSGGTIIHLPPRHEVRHAHSTWQKSVELLGFEHKTSLEDGIANMWEWAKQQPKRKRFIFESYELDKGLYPQWKPEALKDGYYKEGTQ